MKEDGTKENKNDLVNQFKFRVLGLESTNKLLVTGSNHSDNLETINISSQKINKPKTDFIKNLITYIWQIKPRYSGKIVS